MLSLYVRLLSVFALCPGVHFRYSEHEIDVNGPDGLMCAIRGGVCRTADLGGSHPLFLDPIPKVNRLYHEDGGKAPQKVKDYAARKEAAKELVDANGVAQSIVALKAQGFSFDEKGNVTGRPGSAPAPAAPKAIKKVSKKAS